MAETPRRVQEHGEVASGRRYHLAEDAMVRQVRKRRGAQGGRENRFPNQGTLHQIFHKGMLQSPFVEVLSRRAGKRIGLALKWVSGQLDLATAIAALKAVPVKVRPTHVQSGKAL